MELTRRDFLRMISYVGGSLYGIGWLRRAHALWAGPFYPDLVIAQQGSPAEMTRAAVQALGGIERFVKPGQKVVIKANFSWANPPKLATSTNPEVVTALVQLCKQAGARRTVVLDHVIDGLEACLRETEMRAAVLAAGGEIRGYQEEASQYQETSLEPGAPLRSVQVLKEVKEADVLINVPIAKHHSSTRLTLSMKNLMGVIRDRGAFHARDLSGLIAELSRVVKPNLILIDAVRILLDGGPENRSGTAPVAQANKIIASSDPVAADSYAATLFPKVLEGKNVSHVLKAYQLKVGEIDINKLWTMLVNAQEAVPSTVPPLPAEKAPSPDDEGLAALPGTITAIGTPDLGAYRSYVYIPAAGILAGLGLIIARRIRLSRPKRLANRDEIV